MAKKKATMASKPAMPAMPMKGEMAGGKMMKGGKKGGMKGGMKGGKKHC